MGLFKEFDVTITVKVDKEASYLGTVDNAADISDVIKEILYDLDDLEVIDIDASEVRQ